MQYIDSAKTFQGAIEEFIEAKILWLDTEVADYQSQKPQLSLIQVLADPKDVMGDRVVIFDVLDRPEWVKDFVDLIMEDTRIEKVFHNASFDRKFLGKSKAENVTCTLTMAKKIPYYLVPIPKYSLQALVEQFCDGDKINKNMDKSYQVSDWGKRPLSSQQLDYAKMDPVYVAQIHQKLLELVKVASPKPEKEDLQALTLRYRQLEHQWKKLDTEINHLKERLKVAMKAQNVQDREGFKLSHFQRTSRKIAFSALVAASQEMNLELDFPITLTKPIQKQLGEAIADLPIQEEITTITQLKIAEQDEEDLPF
ncbi:MULTISPECIES: ribonuclease D [Spirulina sp. CCY15215]|uniref:ribonuclease D n=1 Tax=Spirulina sp. CCY15215 TaxID=2767591 RepID=UPI001950B245|nr:ribonuclease D [Spirulina major]